MFSAELVRFYPAFTVYNYADFLRVVLAAAALTTCFDMIWPGDRLRLP